MPTFESSLISGNEPAKAHNEGANVLSAIVEVTNALALADLVDFFRLPDGCYVESIRVDADDLDSGGPTLVWKLGTENDDDLFGTGFTHGGAAVADQELLDVDTKGILVGEGIGGKLRLTVTTAATTPAAGGIRLQAIWRMA